MKANLNSILHPSLKCWWFYSLLYSVIYYSHYTYPSDWQISYRLQIRFIEVFILYGCLESQLFSCVPLHYQLTPPRVSSRKSSRILRRRVSGRQSCFIPGQKCKLTIGHNWSLNSSCQLVYHPYLSDSRYFPTEIHNVSYFLLAAIMRHEEAAMQTVRYTR